MFDKEQKRKQLMHIQCSKEQNRDENHKIINIYSSILFTNVIYYATS